LNPTELGLFPDTMYMYSVLIDASFVFKFGHDQLFNKSY